jgi:hypothetical protein
VAAKEETNMATMIGIVGMVLGVIALAVALQMKDAVFGRDEGKVFLHRAENYFIVNSGTILASSHDEFTAYRYRREHPGARVVKAEDLSAYMNKYARAL